MCWQLSREIVEFVGTIVQSGVAVFLAIIAWKTFLREGVQEVTDEDALTSTKPSDLLLFSTSKQKTWLRKTKAGIECHLEDERPGKSSGHRWTMAPHEVKKTVENSQIYVNPGYKLRTGLISIGRHSNWLYSKNLHPDPSELQSKVYALLKSIDA